MTSQEIRQKFLDFQKNKRHAIIPSASIIPVNDSSLLFVNSGMSPLVPFLLGEPHPAGKRLANSQKCFRADDIEEVGDNRHNTFFEMLGNWSLNDYSKKDQLIWWYEFLVEELGLSPERFYQSVYAGDDAVRISRDEESIEVLKEIFNRYGVSAGVGPNTTGKGEFGPGTPVDFSEIRIMAYRDKNWWQRGDATGELGGPDSETFYDTGKSHNPKFGEHCHFNCDCGRFIEIGNSVFMEYCKTDSGWEKLSARNIDFGGGLERLLMAANNQNNIFETDLFSPIISFLEKLSGKKYADDSRAFEIISDHLKAAMFIMGDNAGVAPSNVGRGYIVRRLIRRVVRYGWQIGITTPGWTVKLIPVIQKIYDGVYPELVANNDFISTELLKEEEKFAKTFEDGMKEFSRLASKGIISGKDAFNLYQSCGLPKEDIKEISAQQGIDFDERSFDEEFKKHQELSRTASAGMFKGGLADSSEKTTKLHTVAHLALAALRKVLGEHVSQRGSNITAERLRFDFSHQAKMSNDEIKKVEDLVNEWIACSLPVTIEEMELEKARALGVVGVFDERYGERVKVYSIGDRENISQEICGGPHVTNIGGIGKFKIIKEESVSAGVRRIKAILE